MDEQAAARPRFKSGAEPVIDPDDGLFLLYDVCDGHPGRSTWLPGALPAALAPYLDGRHTVEALFDALCEQHAPDAVLAALDDLRRQGHLADDAAAAPRALRAFWEGLGTPPGQALAGLAQRRVAVHGLGAVAAADLDLLRELLAADGATLTDLPPGSAAVPPGADLLVVLTDDFLHPALEAINRQALAGRQPWLLAKPLGLQPWLGPAFVPGETACWACLAQRLRGHRRLQQHLHRPGLRARPGAGADAVAPQPPQAALPSTRHAILAEIASLATRWLATGQAPALRDQVLAIDLPTLARQPHALTRRPQCPACGTPPDPARLPAPLRLQPRPRHTGAGGGADGGHRSADPRDTLARLQRHLSPITGIVGSLAPGERGGDPALTPTFAADHNFNDLHDPRFFLREGLRRRSGGKGQGAAQARASALAESLERYCGVADGSEPRRVASLAALGEAAIDPNAVALYSARQFAERERLNRREHKAHWVALPLPPQAEIEWTPLWSLTGERLRYLPAAQCWFGHRSSGPVPEPPYARADSNGCAAGAVVEEAILQGLLELIERDAVALWWINRLQRPGLDLASSADPYTAALQAHYRGLQREIWALDVSSDFGVPAFAALSRRIDAESHGAEDILYGFGCHLDPAVALSRALTELNQSLEAVPAATGPEAHRSYRGTTESLRWWREVRRDDEPWLQPDPRCPLRRLADFAPQSSDDLAQDVHHLVGLARERGIEVLVLDQTRPDVGLPVVRVVAPGLRHFWARHGPGRLFDVPVQQGWLPRARTEDELNPHVIQF